MFDTHMHTIPFSTDSGMVFSDLLKVQEEKNIGVILTEHIDIAFGDPSEFYFDPDTYFKELSPYRNDRLLLGVEIGMTADTNDRNREIVGSHPFDMVIGSIHFMRGKDIYYPEFFAMFPGKKEVFSEYLDTMAEMISTFDDFDTLGHIDYIGRVAPYTDPLIYYEDYPDRFDRVLQLLIDKDKSLEINTRQFDKPKAVAALKTICQRYHALGGRYVTIGSDAHSPAVVGAHLSAAYRLARECGLTPVIYMNRQRYVL